MRHNSVIAVSSDVLSGAWHVECGRAEMIRFCHTVMTQPWLSTECTTWAAGILISETSGSCQVHAGWRLWCEGLLSQSCLHNLTEVKISRMNISLSNDEQSEVYFITKCVLGCQCRYTLHTRSLEVDASHFHRVCWVMGHHLCITQKALSSGFRVLAFAAYMPVSQKSN